MHKVKRAIIVAAGEGKRLQPVTLEIPKPLILVNNVRIIDTIIQGLHRNGIFEIYIVVGYMKEKFICLESEYSGVKLIENPYYRTYNNLASLYMAREFIEESVILDGDLIIYNDSVLEPCFKRSGYNCIWTDEETEEWLLTTEDDIVKSCSRSGGSCGWQLYSISRWSREDGKRLKQHLELEFETKQNRQSYWDDLALFCYSDEYQLGICEMKKEDVVEIDSLEELIMLDNSYQKYLNRGNAGGNRKN